VPVFPGCQLQTVTRNPKASRGGFSRSTAALAWYWLTVRMRPHEHDLAAPPPYLLTDSGSSCYGLFRSCGKASNQSHAKAVGTW